ncbi:hypothetical protein F5Y04DRAFT_44850 [Hypomontagnella monticulosa]|nr:hypothetical protein F5Y04DRAFT_44850 [Hypomontagnella monticulosa]
MPEMPDFKGMVKNHESGQIRGKVKGLVGRGDKSSARPTDTRSAAPISSLRDPSSFGPPPRHVAIGGGASPVAPSPGVRNYEPATQLYQPQAGQTYASHQQVQQQPEEVPAEPVEPRPYRVNTTGLSTSHLPPPPLRRDSPGTANQSSAPPPYSPVRPGGPPSLPPRLPPRSGQASPAQAQSPISPGSGSQSPGYFNQGAIDRLGAAGVSVPGLGIGGPPAAPPPAQGTTWAEKQAALNTAASFRKDPSSVSVADARAAAGTAYSFQQRHGEQVASGLRTANGLGQRFSGASDSGQSSPTASSPMGQIAAVIGKKKPPPPPAKKPQLSGSAATEGGAPPPVPSTTRPKFP